MPQLGRDLAVRLPLREEVQQPPVLVPELLRRPPPDRLAPAPDPIRSIGPASSASSLPSGPRSHRTRASSSNVRCTMPDRESWSRPRTVLPRRLIAAGEDRAGRGQEHVQVHVLVQRLLQRPQRGSAASAARSTFPCASATRASAPSACAPHGGWPGSSPSTSFASNAALSATPKSSSSPRAAPSRAASIASRARASQRAAGRPSSVAIATARSRWSRMPCGSFGSRASHAPPQLDLPRAEGGGRARGRRARPLEPPLRLIDLPEIEVGQRQAARGDELD